MFARLFERDRKQVLIVKKNDSIGNPSVEILFRHNELGMCTVRISFEDKIEGRMERDKYFNTVPERVLFDIVKRLYPCVF